MPPQPIDLKVGGQSLRFDTLKEFEFALAGRTSLPYGKIQALAEVPTEALLREVGGIRQLEHRLVDVLERSMTDPGLIGDFLADIDLSTISQDFDWRAVITGLMTLDHSYDSYKKVALVKYLQYLSARQEIVRSAYSSRVLHGADEVEPSQGAGTTVPDTSIFDATPLIPDHDSPGPFGRLPKGETIEIPLLRERSLNIVLARHLFCLVSGAPIRFVDDKQQDCALRPGKNIVGRDASSDVVVHSSYRAVSRRHLIIETEPNDTIRLTDISSLGTFVPAEYLDSTGF